MKKSVLLLLALTLSVPAFAAGTKHKAQSMPSAGAMDSSDDKNVTSEPTIDSCGLGWQVTKKKTMIGTTVRGTTNAFVPPTFGMTSGTIGCDKIDFSKRDQESATFAATNYESLRIEMAEGHGEYLNGFARTLGCGDGAREGFGRMTQKNYKALMNGSSVEMFKNVKNLIQKDAALSASCAA